MERVGEDRYRGRVMWVSHRDGNGILLIDSAEVYMDRSIYKNFSKLKADDTISCEVYRMQGMLVARKIRRVSNG